MSQLPTGALPAAEFLVRHHYRPIDVTAGSRYFAIAETAQAMGGDNWFWTDDNAKVLEFLSLPELWRHYPEATSKILGFVRTMCRGPFIFRRLSAPQLAAGPADGTLTTYRHSLMEIRSDLRRGGLFAGMRFHDERNLTNILLAGNRVEFTYRGRRFKIPAAEGITDCGAEQNGQVIRLWHVGDVAFTFWRRSLRLGRLRYQYTIDARTMLIEVEARLEVDAAIDVSDVVLTIGHDQLGQWNYSTIDADTHTAGPPLFAAGKPGRAAVGVAGAPYYVIRQGHYSGDALALHAAPREPNRLLDIDVAGRIQGRLHCALARYSFPGRQRGACLVVAEHKLLTGGGLYERVHDYAAFMLEAVAAKETQHAAYDFSTSYDYGVVINAFAKCFATCSRAEPAATDELCAELRGLVDTYLGHYLDFAVDGHRDGKNTIFSRELSFVVLAVVTMYRTTGSAEYLGHLRRLCETLLDLERQFVDAGGDPASGFMMRIDAQPIAHVDCHSAALLALVQAAGCLQDDRLTAAVDRGLAAFCLVSCAVDETRRADTVGTLMIDGAGGRRIEPAFWNFKAGLTLRLFAALRNATAPALREINARHRERIELFEMILRRQLEQAITEHGDAIEVRCSTVSGETNSETQPWVMLGLLGHPAD